MKEIILDLWKDFKNKIPIPIIFLIVGYVAGIGTYKYLSHFLNADVVLKDSYVYKSEIYKQYVPIDDYKKLEAELKSLKDEKLLLEKQNTSIQETISDYSKSICEKFEIEAKSLIKEQQQIEKKIQETLSPYTGGIGWNKKEESQLLSDKEKVKELRRHSELLNNQLMQIREKISKFIK